MVNSERLTEQIKAASEFDWLRKVGFPLNSVQKVALDTERELLRGTSFNSALIVALSDGIRGLRSITTRDEQLALYLKVEELIKELNPLQKRNRLLLPTSKLIIPPLLQIGSPFSYCTASVYLSTLQGIIRLSKEYSENFPSPQEYLHMYLQLLPPITSSF